MTTEKKVLQEKTFALLEYGKIMDGVARCAVSEEAAEIIRTSNPLADGASIEQMKAAVSAIYTRMKSGDEEPQSSLPTIASVLSKLGVEGMVLELDEAYAIGIFVERGLAVVKWLGASPDLPALDDTSAGCAAVQTEIFRIVDRDGNLRDLPCFRAIKRRIQTLGAELETAISRYTQDDESRKMLQSLVPSQRDGRTVLAVKSNFRRRIQGIVHEVSSTGQTVFMEPAELVEKNNELLIEKRNLDAEVRRVLRELTENIAGQQQALINFHRAIIEIECLRAKARYCRDTKGNFAHNSEKGDILLGQARHPLLAKPVPIDLKIDGETGALVITGPNTGGKTVALKTAGLFVLMNQSGLALPVGEGALLPVFDAVYADIGDEQSIDQSLSTYSAHIANIAGIIAHSSNHSLILLDELGAGTDPEEGSAVAMAILDHLLEKKARLIITTHHGILKNYAYTRSGVENASVEFDPKTLSPAYRIINGIPGESRALDIAGKNGLNKTIVESARAYLAEGRSDVSALIAGLKEKHRELDSATEKSRAEEHKLREDRRRTDLAALRVRQKEMELKQGVMGKLRLLLDESRKTLENLVREVREGELDREKTLKVKDFLTSLAQTVDAEENALDEEEKALHEEKQRAERKTQVAVAGSASAEQEFAIGMAVLAGKQRKRGTIVRAGKKNSRGKSWLVEIGALKISFPESELLPAPTAQADAQPQTAGWAADLASSGEFRYELNLRGMRMEEALDALRRQIDGAVLAGVREFSVVHGKGDGILQKGVHDYLKAESAVADYYFSRPEMGGFGRTDVILR